MVKTRINSKVESELRDEVQIIFCHHPFTCISNFRNVLLPDVNLDLLLDIIDGPCFCSVFGLTFLWTIKCRR